MRAELEISLPLNEIISAIGGFITTPPENLEIKSITTDTRDMKRGDLFIALPGKNFNGESFCLEAEEAGAICISRSYKGGILVYDTEAALCSIAALYRQKLLNLKCVIGITGSVGKTTTKEFLKLLLSGSKKVHANIGNFNNHIGVAHTILTCPADAEILIAEMGMNHIGEIKISSLMLRPNIAVITKIGTAHIGNLGSVEMIAKEKMEITAGLSESGVLMIPYGEGELKPKCRYKTVSINAEGADLTLLPIEASRNGTRFVLKQKGGVASVESTSIFGIGNLRSLAFCIACALEIGLDKKSITDAFSLISPKNTRQNVEYWQNRCIIDDSYNASLESVISSFDFLQFFPGRHCAVLGDVLELGSKTESIHFKIGSEAFAHGIKLLFLFGVYAPFIARGAVAAGMERSKIFINSDPESPEITEKCIIENTKEGDVILFKASHRSELSSMIERIKGYRKD